MLQDHLLAIVLKVQEHNVQVLQKQQNVVLLVESQVQLQKVEVALVLQKEEQLQADLVEDKKIDFWLVSLGSPLLQIALGTSLFICFRESGQSYTIRDLFPINKILDTLRIFRDQNSETNYEQINHPCCDPDTFYRL